MLVAVSKRDGPRGDPILDGQAVCWRVALLTRSLLRRSPPAGLGFWLSWLCGPAHRRVALVFHASAPFSGGFVGNESASPRFNNFRPSPLATQLVKKPSRDAMVAAETLYRIRSAH